jgi:hypothetical protein
VLPQVHALPQVRHARPTPHSHLSEERDRGHLEGYLLRELQSRPRQRQRSLPVLLARGQRQGSRCRPPGRFDKSGSVSQSGKHRDSIGCLKDQPVPSSPRRRRSWAVDVQLHAFAVQCSIFLVNNTSTTPHRLTSGGSYRALHSLPPISQDATLRSRSKKKPLFSSHLYTPSTLSNQPTHLIFLPPSYRKSDRTTSTHFRINL